MDYSKAADEAFEYLSKVNSFAVMKMVNDASQGEQVVLGHLTFEQDGVTAGELSGVFGLGSSRIAAILNALTKKGLARRASDPDDGRVVRVFVTDEGREKAIERKSLFKIRMVRMLEQLGEEDAKDFVRIIEKIVKLGEMADQDK